MCARTFIYLHTCRRQDGSQKEEHVEEEGTERTETKTVSEKNKTESVPMVAVTAALKDKVEEKGGEEEEEECYDGETAFGKPTWMVMQRRLPRCCLHKSRSPSSTTREHMCTPLHEAAGRGHHSSL